MTTTISPVLGVSEQRETLACRELRRSSTAGRETNYERAGTVLAAA